MLVYLFNAHGIGLSGSDLNDWHLDNKSRSYLQNKEDDNFLSGF